MPKVKFLGKILPEIFNITIVYNPSIKWKAEKIGFDLTFTYKIENSIIEIECDLEKWQPEYLGDVYKRAYDIIRTGVSLITFSTGNVLQIYLDRFVNPDGQETPLAIMNPELPALCTSFSLSKNIEDKNTAFDSIFNIVLSDPAIFLALSDLCVAISVHDQTTTGCARALEGIRLLIWGYDTPTDKERIPSWKKLQETLRVSEQYLKLITENSIGSRHGSRKFIPGTTTTEIVKRSWIIMNRYLELRLRKIEQLPLAEFPLLS